MCVSGAVVLMNLVSGASLETIEASDPFPVDVPRDVTPKGDKRPAVLGDFDGDVDSPSPTKRTRMAGLRGRRNAS